MLAWAGAAWQVGGREDDARPVPRLLRPEPEEVETILAQRGVIVGYESVRAWGLRFGRAFADAPEKGRPRPGDEWHPDEARHLPTAVEHRAARDRAFQTWGDVTGAAPAA